MERQEHLEASADSDDMKKCEEHRVVARWIKHFITVVKQELVDWDEAVRHPEPPPTSEYMDFDSESGIPEGRSAP